MSDTIRATPDSKASGILRDSNPKILVVDDDPNIHDDYRQILCVATSPKHKNLGQLEAELLGDSSQFNTLDNFDVGFSLQGADALDRITTAKAEGHPYAVAFLDVRAPSGWDSIETAQRLWQVDANLLIVICSEHSDYSWSELVARLGANDRWLILKKPFDAVEVRQLALALTQKWSSNRQNQRYYLSLERMVDDRTEALHKEMSKLREAEREVSYLAQHDTLTSLPNRRFMENHLSYQVQQAKRHDRGLAVISADLDRFKWINDTLGHAAGDLVLKTVAARLKESLRNCDCVARGDKEPQANGKDTVARLGGDEFVVLLTDVKSPEDVAQVARRITDLMSQPINVDGRDISAGASLGIAIQPADGDDPETLLRKADLAMYHAKSSGQNSFRFYTSELHRGFDNRLWLENEMKKAIEHDAFKLAFQPEVDAVRSVVIGAEALMRWHHPERGFISPAEFIPVAEETGLILQLGAWALKEACKKAVIAVDRIPTFEHIAVNVSAKQLRDEKFVDLVEHVLQTTGLGANHLELEITESAFIEQGVVDESLRRLRELGVRIALDDFGTGYSSLAHLARWPIDTVKIDRSFVKDLESSRSLGIVRGIMALAGCFAGRVVAEGIEESRQRDILQSEGCTVMQGYMFCKPVAFEEFISWSCTALTPRSSRPVSHRPQFVQLQLSQGAA